MMEYFFMGGFEIMFLMVFVLIFGMILVVIVRGIGEWGKNNRSPRLDVSATVVSKRTHTMRNQNHTSSSTMLPFRWKAETGWNSGWAEESMGFWQREIRESFIFRERDIWGLTGTGRAGKWIWMRKMTHLKGNFILLLLDLWMDCHYNRKEWVLARFMRVKAACSEGEIAQYG